MLASLFASLSDPFAATVPTHSTFNYQPLCLSSSRSVFSLLWGSLSRSRSFPLDKCTAKRHHKPPAQRRAEAEALCMMTDSHSTVCLVSLTTSAAPGSPVTPAGGGRASTWFWTPSQKRFEISVFSMDRSLVFCAKCILQVFPHAKCIFVWCFSFAIIVQQDYFLSSCCNPLYSQHQSNCSHLRGQKKSANYALSIQILARFLLASRQIWLLLKKKK